MISNTLYQKYATDPAAFRADLLVDVDGAVRRFGDVQDDWQKTDFASIDGALLRCTGRSTTAARMRAWLERARGHSKTTDIAVVCCWALAFATRPLKAYAYAADKDQAQLLRQAMHTLVRLNPWLGTLLQVEAHRVVNIASGHPGEGSTLTIEASDVGSSYGILPDLIVADEVCHWEGEGELWHSLVSSAAKRSNCLLLAITNAGFVDSWQWLAREAVRTSEDWYFSRQDGVVAGWLLKNPSILREQRALLPRIAFSRLWENVWSRGGGDALLPGDIAAAFRDDLSFMTGKEKGLRFVAGVDLGLTRDASAVVVLGTPNDGSAGKIRLAHHRLWKPTPGRKVDLMEIEKHILGLDERFGLEFVAFDPWQAELLAQRLEADAGHRRRNQKRLYRNQPWAREVPPTAANLRQQASTVIECFTDHRLQLYPCPALRYDLEHLRCEERGGGFRLTSPRDVTGHGDSASAFALALLLAHEAAGKKKILLRVMNGDNLTANNLHSAWDRRLEEYEREMQLLSQPNDDQEPFKQMMNRSFPHRIRTR